MLARNLADRTTGRHQIAKPLSIELTRLMRMPNDWRLTNQEKYLKGVTLFWKQYAPINLTNDHDHCEFCAAKFAVGQSGTLAEGYSSANGYRWICKPCFEDFVDIFEWSVASTPSVDSMTVGS